MLLDSETGLKIKEQVLSTDGAVVNCTTLYHPLFEWRVKFLKKTQNFCLNNLADGMTGVYDSSPCPLLERKNLRATAHTT